MCVVSLRRAVPLAPHGVAGSVWLPRFPARSAFRRINAHLSTVVPCTCHAPLDSETGTERRVQLWLAARAPWATPRPETPLVGPARRCCSSWQSRWARGATRPRGRRCRRRHFCRRVCRRCTPPSVCAPFLPLSNARRPDYLATVDVKAGSDTYSQVGSSSGGATRRRRRRRQRQRQRRRQRLVNPRNPTMPPNHSHAGRAPELPP